jgi:hypothetical protein
MVIVGNAIPRHPVEAGIPLGSPVSLILFAFYMAGLIQWVDERVLAVEGVSFVGDVGWVATGNYVTYNMRTNIACAHSEH